MDEVYADLIDRFHSYQTDPGEIYDILQLGYPSQYNRFLGTLLNREIATFQEDKLNIWLSKANNCLTSLKNTGVLR